MSERLDGLAQARKQLDAGWSRERAQRGWSGVQRRQRRRRILRVVAAAGVVLVLALLGGERRAPAPGGPAGWVRRGPSGGAAPASVPEGMKRRSAVAGSATEATPEETASEQVSRVPLPLASPAPVLPAPLAPPPAPRPRRSAEPAPPAQSPQAQPPAQSPPAQVPPAQSPRAQVPPAQSPPAQSPPAQPPRAAPERPRQTWRDLALDGEFERSYGALREAGAAVGEDPEDLLLRADVARLSHHPGEALGPLERFLSRHAADPRAPLAAFTLGRVLLDELGRPRDAAAAFSRAQALAPAGEMAQDALAREVEAWSRAGDLRAARARAGDYLERYPQGRRLRSVRRFGGLE